MKSSIAPIDAPNGQFVDGNPLTGAVGTRVTALWLNAMQAATIAMQGEMLKIMQAAGIALDDSVTPGQLLAALNTLYAGLASPNLSGTPTAPTAALGTNTQQLATTAFVQAALTALVGGAPGAMDTLKELADALGDDANFAANITNLLALKAPLNSPALTGTPTVPTPVAGSNDGQIPNTQWVRALFTGFLSASSVITPTNDTTFANNSNSPASTSWIRGAMSSIAAAAGFSKSLSANGYLKLPSWLGGLIIQWGVVTVAPESGITVSMPITFPNAILSTFATIQSTTINGTGNYSAYATGTSTSTIIVSQDVSTTAGASNQSICWFTIGW